MAVFSNELDPKNLGDRTKVGKQSIDFIGQVEDRPYAERQRQPGDYEVQVSQRPIAIHALENLATSDRGVAMLRRLIRRGIRALVAGTEPASYPTGTDGTVATYCQDTVWPAPDTVALDQQTVLAEFGKTVAEAVLASSGTPNMRRISIESSTRSKFRT